MMSSPLSGPMIRVRDLTEARAAVSDAAGRAFILASPVDAGAVLGAAWFAELLTALGPIDGMTPLFDAGTRIGAAMTAIDLNIPVIALAPDLPGYPVLSARAAQRGILVVPTSDWELQSPDA